MALSPAALLATNQGNKTFSGDVTFTGNVTATGDIAAGLITRSKSISFLVDAGGSQTINSSAWPPTPITGNITFENHYGSSNWSNSVYTIPVAGNYFLGCNVAADFGTSGPRDIDDSRIFLTITPNGGTVFYKTITGEMRSNPMDDVLYLNGSAIRNFGVGDTVSFGYYFTESGVSPTLSATTNYFGFLLF